MGVQRSEWPEREFVLLQNQGGLRVKLRGHAVASEGVFAGKSLEGRSFAFADEVLIPPGSFVMLHSGYGDAQWRRSKDDAMVYHAFACKERPLWNDCQGTLHLLAPQHEFSPAREVLVLR